MFSWNKEKGFSISLKVEFRSLIVKYLVMLFSELTAWMKLSTLGIAGFAIWANLTCFSDCLNSLLFNLENGRNILKCKAYSTNESSQA